jgi:Ca2+-binding RTX toxin-like protein
MIRLGKTTSAGSFDFFSGLGDKELTYACSMAYAKDLNGDGIDEVIFSGWETQPNTPSKYSNTQITIFGWRNGIFQNLTNQFLPNRINQVEGVGSIAFGDYNGDGRLDMFWSAYSDMDHDVKPYVLLNNGNSFTRQELAKTRWQHDSTAYDINKDGFSDLVVVGYGPGPAIYLGSSSGLVKQEITDSIGGSGVVVDDFLGDGSSSIIIIDHGHTRDFGLYKFADISNGQVKLEYVSTLPRARFDQPLYNLPFYGPTNDPAGRSHDIRAVSLDFNDDGKKDVVVISRPSWNGESWQQYSEVQFLKNVTDSVLKNYDTKSSASYAPDVRDFNGDGLVDIFLSEGSFDVKQNSTTILFQRSNGTFTDSARSTLSGLIRGDGGKAAIARGPDNNYHLVSALQKHTGVTDVEITALTFTNEYSGTNGNDILTGSRISDNITGLLGDDFIEGLAGNDTLDGGMGIDTVSYKSAESGVRVNLSGQWAVSIGKNNEAAIGRDTVINFEDIFGSEFDDLVIGDHRSNVLNGGAGNDTLNGAGGKDTFIGGPGADKFILDSRPSKSNFDILQDFEPGVDQIGVHKNSFSWTIFRSWSIPKKNSPDFLLDDEPLVTRKPTYMYNDDSGILSYDRDGIGYAPAVDMAYIGIGLDLRATDFFVI